MTRHGRTRRVARERSGQFVQVARAFLTAAEALDEVGIDGDTYGNAIALVAIHAAIGFADALTVSWSGFKSTDPDHTLQVAALKAALGARLRAKEEKALARVLGYKDSVSYQGNYFPLEEARRLLTMVREFAEWAEEAYAERPS